MVFFPFPFRNWSHMMEPPLLCLIISTCPDSVHTGNSHGHFKVPPWVLSILYVDTLGTVGILSVSGKRHCRLCDGESMTCDLTLWAVCAGLGLPGSAGSHRAVCIVFSGPAMFVGYCRRRRSAQSSLSHCTVYKQINR
ncbi:hypothetical protein FJT64_019384 [Amphibalanus amphitrite]|uniref:Uncharacterized protein n=1 Tax=Amphibalanus amphitrite TaxID=1232801 RepID=A0A6A4X529_AMPAM|nr:hypothetical protein FJT64_019384 [Amphibalanus amphitrite]